VVRRGLGHHAGGSACGPGRVAADMAAQRDFWHRNEAAASDP